jgi:hypothetical protein
MSYGFTTQSEGLLVEKKFYQLTNHALAFLSIHPHTDQLLRETIQTISQKPGQIHAPLLHAIAQSQDPIKLYASFVEQTFGTAKSVFESVVQPESQQTLATITRQHQTTITIQSRRKGQIARPKEITIKRPLIISIEDLAHTSFENGDHSEQRLSGRADPLSPGIRSDNAFLQNISYSHAFSDVQIVGHTRACALLALKYGLDDGSVKFSSDATVRGDVFVPFDFQKVPHYAFEVSLMKTAPRWFLQTVIGKKSCTTKDTDAYLRGKTGFQTAQFNTAVKHGQATIGSLIGPRELHDGGTYLLHALLDHQLGTKNRLFCGMTQVFTQTSQETTAVLCTNPQRTLETYILCAPHIPGPVMMYVNYDSPLRAKKEQIAPLQNRPLIEMLNYQNQSTVKKFSIIDRLGRFGVCTVYHPSDEQFERASQFAQKAHARYTTASIKAYYIERMRNAVQKYA